MTSAGGRVQSTTGPGVGFPEAFRSDAIVRLPFAQYDGDEVGPGSASRERSVVTALRQPQSDPRSPLTDPGARGIEATVSCTRVGGWRTVVS